MRTLFVALSLALVAPANAQSPVGTTGGSGREAFTAVALSSGGPRTRPVATNLEIVIERWSTPEERQRLRDAISRGQSAALDVMRNLEPVGYIRVPPNLGWELRYAEQAIDDGQRRIFLGTDRPISFAEEVLQPLSADYPFTFIELHVNAEGEGEGTLSRATRVTASDDARFIHLENWGVDPIQLTEVKPQ